MNLVHHLLLFDQQQIYDHFQLAPTAGSVADESLWPGKNPDSRGTRYATTPDLARSNKGIHVVAPLR